MSDVDDKASQPSEVSDGPLASSAAEKFAKAEIAALKAKQEKKRLKEELKLQEKAAQIKIQQEEDEAERLKMEAELLSKCAGSKVQKTEKPSQKVSKGTSYSRKQRAMKTKNSIRKMSTECSKELKNPH